MTDRPAPRPPPARPTLNPTDHPAGTKVRCRYGDRQKWVALVNGWRGQIVGLTVEGGAIVEVSDLPLVVEVLERPMEQPTPAPSGHWTREPVPVEWYGRSFWVRDDDGDFVAALYSTPRHKDRWSTPIPLPGEERSEETHAAGWRKACFTAQRERDDARAEVERLRNYRDRLLQETERLRASLARAREEAAVVPRKHAEFHESASKLDREHGPSSAAGRVHDHRATTARKIEHEIRALRRAGDEEQYDADRDPLDTQPGEDFGDIQPGPQREEDVFEAVAKEWYSQIRVGNFDDNTLERQLAAMFRSRLDALSALRAKLAAAERERDAAVRMRKEAEAKESEASARIAAAEQAAEAMRAIEAWLRGEDFRFIEASAVVGEGEVQITLEEHCADPDGGRVVAQEAGDNLPAAILAALQRAAGEMEKEGK